MTSFIKSNKLFFLLTTALFLGILLTYLNHFHNQFHFDDSHTIVDNVYIRNIRNLPLFFINGSTMSSLAANASYRPLFTASVAVDYWLAGGLNPFVFHLSNFFWFIIQGILMFFMFKKIFDLSCTHAWNRYVSLFAVGWYVLHPANAETINYISARSDFYSTLCVIAGIVLYQYFPRGRSKLAYLVPVAIGGLAKPVALIFAPILLVYKLFFETSNSATQLRPGLITPELKKVLLGSLPAWILCIVLLTLNSVMTPAHFNAAGLNTRWNYFITQPFVIFRYFRVFFLPWDLSADSDWEALSTIRDDRFCAGIIFIISLIVCAFTFFRKVELRPAGFGILWFLLALFPTSSIYPLAEVTNDHRMFFPFVGLTLGVCWTIRSILVRHQETLLQFRKNHILLFLGTLCILSIYAHKTYERNKVWHTEESLWHDVTLKSPKNGRGLMNYGLTQMAAGRYDIALSYFENALKYTPNYSFLHINLGIVKNELNRKEEAEKHFQYAIQYSPEYEGAYYYYGVWLGKQNRAKEAVTMLQKSVSLGPRLEARHLLMKLYTQDSEWDKLSDLAHETLGLSPNDTESINAIKIINQRQNQKHS